MAQSSTSYGIDTFAGLRVSGDGGPAVEAWLDNPRGVAVDLAGNLYIADTYNHRVRRVDATGTITTIAGTGERGFSGDGGPASQAQLDFPDDVAADRAGNVYIADSYNHRVRRVDATGTITTIAGTGELGFSGDGGPASQAQLSEPGGIALDVAGNVYIADTYNHRIRKVDAAGTITTIAGSGERGFSGDGGPASQAQLFAPFDVAADGLGNLYIVDSFNDRIRKVDATGTITTIAGTGEYGFGGDGGPASQAQLFYPRGVAVDGPGNVYIAAGSRIRKVDSTGTITTIAGRGGFFGGDGGPAVEAQFHYPSGMAVDVAGNLYIADTGNHRIRKVDATGTITTIAGRTFSGDGGPASQAQLSEPEGVAADRAGNVYIADSNNHRIRKVDATGTITTIAGTGESGFSGDGGPASQAQLSLPRGVAVDGLGNLYIADRSNSRIRKVDLTGTITTIAGSGAYGFGGDGGPASQAQLSEPYGVAVGGLGNLYIGDRNNQRIRKVDLTGTITTIAGTGERGFGGDGGPASQAQLSEPEGVAVDEAGNLYIADSFNYRIRKVDATGTITTIAGTGERGFGGDGGPASQAQLSNPGGVAVDGLGNLYIVDSFNNRIRKVDATGTITTIAGSGERGFAGDSGPAVEAALDLPVDAAVDRAGYVYIADWLNHVIRKLAPMTGPVTTVPVIPGGSGSFSISATTPSSLTVEWKEPENTGSAITDYDVRYREVGSGSDFIDAQHTGTARSATLTGLSPGTAYEVQVRATNAAGTGAWSQLGIVRTSPLPTGGQIYYFPHLAVGASWQTTITYINFSSQEVTCRTDFLSDHGTPLMVSFAGLGTVDSRTDVLPPGGSVHQETDVDLNASLAPGWARATCSGPVQASLLYRQHNSEGGPTAEAGVNATAVPATRFVTFAEQGEDQFGTGVAYANPSAISVPVTFTARDGVGEVLASVVRTLSPGGHDAHGMSELFDLTSFTGSIEVTSTEPIVSLSINFEADPVFSSLPPGELDASAQGSTTYYFPHLAVGASWQTTITYINYSPEEVTCQTEFLSDHGSPLMVSFAALGTVPSRTDVLPPGGSVHQETNVDLNASLAPGWARATCSGPVQASLLYRLHNSEGAPTAEAGVNATAVPATRFVTFAEQGEDQFGTGVAYANPSAISVPVTFTARDGVGEVLASVVRTLSPGGHDAHGMSELFDLTSFTGSIEVTSTEPIVSLSINFEAAPVFSSLPPGETIDIPGVMLAPANEAAFNNLVVGKRISSGVPNYYSDFISPGRFRETAGTDIWTGSYTYRNTGPNTGTVTFNYDDGDRCVASFTFVSTTAGTATYTCNDGESGESNWRLVEIPASAGAPDLVVQTPSVSDSNPNAGESFTLSAAVRNQGNGRSASTTLRYYRSSDETISTSDTAVGTDAVGGLAASGTSAESISLTVPSTAGTYYYGACVDPVSGESNSQNNCSTARRVTVTATGRGEDTVTRAEFEASTPTDYVGVTLSDNGSVWGVPEKYTSDSSHGTVAYMLLGTMKGCSFANAEADGSSKAYIKTQQLGSLPNYESVSVCRKTSRSWNSFAGTRMTHLRFFDESSPTNIREYVYDAATGRYDETIPPAPAPGGNSGSGSEDVYVRHESLTIGRGWVRYLNATDYASGSDCFDLTGSTILHNGVPYILISSKWQTRANSSDAWADIPGTSESGRLCAYDPVDPGEYRFVAEISINGVVGKYSSNILGEGFDLASANSLASGITYANGKFYVASFSGGFNNKVYAYQPSGQRDRASDFDMDDSSYAEGITYANGKFYVVGSYSRDFQKVYAYQPSGQRDSASDFDLDPDNGGATGITFANDRFYVVDRTDVKVYAYHASGQHDSASDFDLDPDNGGATGITFANDRFYVVDRTDVKVYAYHASGQLDSASDFDLDPDNDDAGGITFANDQLYVVDSGDDKVYAYSAGAGPGTTDSQPSFGSATASDQSYQAGAAISALTLPAASGGDGTLTYSLSPAVAGLSFNATTRVLSGTPTTVSSYGMAYTARDADGDIATLRFTITVAGSGSFAPADEQAFNRLVVGNRLHVNPLRAGSFYIDFPSAGRFLESGSLPGSYSYASTGSDTGTMTLTFDGGNLGGSCTLLLTFVSATTGTLSYTCASGRQGQRSWTITAIDVPPLGFSEGESATRGIWENTPPGINVGGPVSAVGGDSLTYTISGTDSESFVILPETGQIRTREGVTYDYETKNRYFVTVGVEDDSGNRDTIDVTIQIVNLAPACEPPSNFRVNYSDERLTLRWSPLSDMIGHARVLGYETEIRRGTSGAWSDRRTFLGRNIGSMIYAGLDNEIGYQVRVRPINAEGDCQWSTPVSGIPTADFAPKDPEGPIDRFGPQPVGTPERNFRFLTPRRCRHTSNGQTLDADCEYENTGPDSGRIFLEFDDPSQGSCEITLAYSSLTAGSFIDECFDAGVNTNVPFDRSFRMPPLSEQDGEVEVPRAPRSQEEFDVLAWGRDDFIPGLGFGCPPVRDEDECEFSPGNGYTVGRDSATGLPVWTLGEYTYMNTGASTGVLTFRDARGGSYTFTLDFGRSGSMRATIEAPGGGASVWPGMPHLDLPLGAQPVLLPIPPSWSAALAIEADFAPEPANANRVRKELFDRFFPDAAALVFGEGGLEYRQNYLKLGRNRAIQTIEFPWGDPKFISGRDEAETARWLTLNGTTWSFNLTFTSDGAARFTLTLTKEGYLPTVVEGFVDFHGDGISVDEFPEELLLPDEPPQASGEDVSGVEVATAITASSIEPDDQQVLLVSAAGGNYQPGDWLEPKDGGNQRMMIVGAGQVSAARRGEPSPAAPAQFHPQILKSQATVSAHSSPNFAEAVALLRRKAGSPVYSNSNSAITRLSVVCMQMGHDIPTRGARYFSVPKTAQNDVQGCQRNCVLEETKNIQLCVWKCEASPEGR